MPMRTMPAPATARFSRRERRIDIMAIRMGEGLPADRQAAEIGEPIDMGGVTVRFHPAGHVLGSAQIAVERRRSADRRRR